MPKKPTHGGKRKGAGRKALYGPTVTRRIPVVLAEFISAYGFERLIKFVLKETR
jgi:hypothetical protein